VLVIHGFWSTTHGLSLRAKFFDEDPSEILAWRGRDCEDLLQNLAAARLGGQIGADGDVARGPDLADCLDGFFSVQGALSALTPPAVSSTALLDRAARRRYLGPGPLPD